tara:strand:+ start:11538 stop:11750 length:213 start_codon:yes stop_codon:yes gene_type:complete
LITKRKSLTKTNKEDILNLFYRTVLRENEKIIDNRTVTISKELSINKIVVDEFLTKHLDQKFLIINMKIA